LNQAAGQNSSLPPEGGVPVGCGTPPSEGSGTGIVGTCRLKPAFRHKIAWGGELDAALALAWPEAL
jgi:hypothetical protein